MVIAMDGDMKDKGDLHLTEKRCHNSIMASGDTIPTHSEVEEVSDNNDKSDEFAAFFWFCNDQRKHGITKDLSKKWTEAEPDVKRKYVTMMKEGKNKFVEKSTEFNKSKRDNTLEADESRCANLND